MLSLIVAFALSQTPPQGWEIESPKKIQGPPAPKGTTNGRFAIVNPNGTLAVKTTFMLDTATGRVWQLVEDAKGQHPAWEEMEVR